MSFKLTQALLPPVGLPQIQQNGRLIAICFQCYLRFSEKGERIETTESKIQRRLQRSSKSKRCLKTCNGSESYLQDIYIWKRTTKQH
ncbi:hypothetical protein NC652_038524 [Populus alba x Populus x berolinensis]|nr:hypothetical protein NC652_038524 [Populus alba x Populus x berolinensis]